MGRAFLAAAPRAQPGTVFVSMQDSAIAHYDCLSDTAQTIAAHADDAASTQITCMQSVPGCDQIVVGRGQLMLLYDQRVQRPVHVGQTLFPLWPSATFFTEHALAAWNSLSFSPAGFSVQSHCQFVDMRMPGTWAARPSWNLPADMATQWALTVSKAPSD